ncbi:unnamed protein product [Linum tenue]|uniref:Uncharacterized protein n=1 Tax=Linum tenue TaxID=586396 RepID=A0AAV0I7R0_9ROSI|nr:unnamed protein product [Linum tenue]
MERIAFLFLSLLRNPECSDKASERSANESRSRSLNILLPWSDPLSGFPPLHCRKNEICSLAGSAFISGRGIVAGRKKWREERKATG